MARGECQPVDAPGPPLREPVRIAGEKRVTKRLLGRARHHIAFESIRHNATQFLRNLPHVEGLALEPIDERQQVARRRNTARFEGQRFGEQGARRDNVRGTASVEQDAGKPRMKRNPLELSPKRRHARGGAGALDSAQPFEQSEGGVHPIRRRPFEPLERRRVRAPRQQVEQGRGEIDAGDLRLTMRAQPVPALPEPAHESRSKAGGTAGALVS